MSPVQLLLVFVALFLFTAPFTAHARPNSHHDEPCFSDSSPEELLQQPKDRMTPILAKLASQPPLTISGLSSGAFFTGQLSVAFSRLIGAAGVVAGGVYNGAQNNVVTALTIMDHPQYISLPLIHSQVGTYQGLGYVDPIEYISQQIVYIFAGLKDTTVHPDNGKVMAEFYRNYNTKVSLVNHIPAEHAFLTTKSGHRECGYKGTPFINNCNFDLVYDMYRTFYPQQPLQPPAEPIISNLHALDQYLFVPPQYNLFFLTNGIERRSYIYVPEACEYILETPLFRLLKYDQQRAEDSAVPGVKQREFENLRAKLWESSAIQAYMNSTNPADLTGHLFDLSDTGASTKPNGAPQCRASLAFHGCKQTLKHIELSYVTNTGYLEYAEANNTIMIFPQAATTMANPNGCWDWWGYSTSLYATKYGVQPLTAMNQGLTIISML